MQAKSVIKFKAVIGLGVAAVMSVGTAAYAQDDVKAPPPIPIVLFDSDASYGDNVPTIIVNVRDALRNNKRLEVMLFNPDSPTFLLAAKSANPPISLDAMVGSAQQQSLASAVGASYFILLKPADRDHKVTVDMTEVSTGSQQHIAKPESPNDVAGDIASQILSWPPPAAPVTTPPTSPPLAPLPVITPAPIIAKPTPLLDTNAVTPMPPATTLPPVTAPPTVSSPVSAPTPANQSDDATPAQPESPPLLSPGVPAAIVSPTLDTTVRNAKRVTTSAAPVQPVSQVNLQPSNAKIQQPTDVQLPVPVQAAPAINRLGSSPILASPQKMAALPNTGTSVTVTGVTVANSPAYTDSGVAQTAQPTAAQSPLGEGVSDAAKQLIDEGDASMKSSDAVTAIGEYRKAVALSPRAASPRLKLAEAYADAGMKDEAAEEARRALAIDPGNQDVQTFIKSQDMGAGGPSGDVLIAQAQTESDPNNPAAWIALGDAYWNVSDPDDSLISYKRAADIDPTAVTPQTRLAKLYAARAQYDESLAALKKSGMDGYPFALKIISSRSDSLVGDLDDETQAFVKGQETREQFYAKIKEVASQAEGLADFVAKITPPEQYKVSQLHRELSTRLLAQSAAVWVDYAETNNSADQDQAADLEKHAINEIQTASVAEDLQSRIKP